MHPGKAIEMGPIFAIMGSFLDKSSTISLIKQSKHQKDWLKYFTGISFSGKPDLLMQTLFGSKENLIVYFGHTLP